MHTTQHETLADAIMRAVNRSKDKSLEAAAVKAGISFRTMQYLVSGVTKKPHGRTVEGLSRLLRVSENEVRRLAAVEPS